MAKKLDCDRRTIINYEQGVCEPKSSQLFCWLHTCKIDLKPLLVQIRNFKESIFLLFSLPLISAGLISFVYVTVISLCCLYGIIRTQEYIFKTAFIIMLMYSIEYITVDYFYEYLKTKINNPAITSTLFYIYQLTFTLVSIFTFKTWVINKNHCRNKIYSKMVISIFSYITIVISTSIIENIMYNFYNIKHFNFLYDNFEGFIYMGMISMIFTLLSMVISHEKELKIKTEQC